MPRWQFQACCLHLCRNGKRQQKEERFCVSGSCISRHHFCFPSSSCSPAELPSAQSPCSEHRGQAHELVPPGPKFCGISTGLMDVSWGWRVWSVCAWKWHSSNVWDWWKQECPKACGPSPACARQSALTLILSGHRWLISFPQSNLIFCPHKWPWETSWAGIKGIWNGTCERPGVCLPQELAMPEQQSQSSTRLSETWLNSLHCVFWGKPHAASYKRWTQALVQSLHVHGKLIASPCKSLSFPCLAHIS